MCDLCSDCLEPLVPVYIRQNKLDKFKVKHSRICCSHLLCEYCGKIVITDGEYLSEEWYTAKEFDKIYPESMDICD